MKRHCLTILSILVTVTILLVSIASGMADEESTKNKGYLGVAIEQLDQRLQKDLNAEFGVVVSRVELDSPADNYGLTEDDVIQYVNEIKIRRPHTLTRIIRKINPGDEAKIQVIRDGKPKTIKVVIGEIKD
ncbi:MAG: PDZ domain-containing protein, partial [bacterium]|nr:PDZ domain-containing protein [bacterium]